MQAFMEMGKFNLKCTQNRGEKIFLRKFRSRDVPLTRLYWRCQIGVQTLMLKLMQDKKVQNELLELVFEYATVKVPKE